MMRLVAIVIALQLAAFAAESAAQTAGITGRTSHGALRVGIRIAAAGESGSAYRTFESSLDAAMRSDTRPLDWALAATASPKPSRTIGAATPQFDGDLFRAAQAAPNDALVQWLVANHADTSTPDGAAQRAAAVDTLTRIEPDNGAAWMEALADADKRGDANAAGDALTRMAESRRFDDHFVGVVHAWLDVYDRHPPPVEFASDGVGAAFVVGFAKAAATALPAYQSIILACKPPATGDAAFDRAARCTTIGRTMLHHGTTLIARSIGFRVLQKLDTVDDADRAAERDTDWYFAHPIDGKGFAEDPRDANPRDLLAYELDWRRMDDEIDVIKSALRRAGVSAEAPEGWTAPHASPVATAR
jgi:hypothetical protein